MTLQCVSSNVESKDIFRKRTFGRFACLPSESIVDRPYEPYVERANNFVGSNRKRFFPEIDMVVRETLFLRNAIGLICKAYRALTDSIATLEIGVHMISITANDQCNGEPTPEGIHQDGNNLFCALLMSRECSGGESLIFDLKNNLVEKKVMFNNFDSLIAMDTNLKHSVTSIEPLDNGYGVRNTFIIDLYDPENLHLLFNSSNFSAPESMLEKDVIC